MTETPQASNVQQVRSRGGRPRDPGIDVAIREAALDLLAEKLGSSQERFRLREDIRRAIEADELPQYRVALDTSTQPDDVVFYTRDSRRLSVELLRIKGGSWFQDLERSDNVAKWNTPGKGQRERVPTTRDLPLA